MVYLRAQRAPRKRVVRIANQLDGNSIPNGHPPNAGVRAVVGARAPYDSQFAGFSIHGPLTLFHRLRRRRENAGLRYASRSGPWGLLRTVLSQARLSK